MWLARRATRVVSLAALAVACSPGASDDGDDESSESDSSTEDDTGDSEESDTETGFPDDCPDDPDKYLPGQCGCGVPDVDSDSDGFADCVDTCVNLPNTNQDDTDEDGLGNGCDACPNDPDDACRCEPNPVECTDGMAGDFPCLGMDLVFHAPAGFFGAGGTNDVWGWTDPLTNREYAIVGVDTGVAFVDVTDAECPAYVGLLPTHSTKSGWRDMKVYGDHMFGVSEADEHGLQVFDLTQLADVAEPPALFEESAHFDGFGNAHNIAINDVTATAFVVGGSECNGGIYMLDVSDPLTPVHVGCYDPFAVHDTQCVVYAGPDTEHVDKELCFTSNGSELNVGVIDVTDRENPIELSLTTYEGAVYPHQGWLTDDHTYFFLGDEADEIAGVDTTTYIWDMTDLDAPVMMGTYVAQTQSTDHNMYVRDGLLWQANYSAGLRVLDIADAANANLVEVGYFDGYPPDDAAGYGTAWGVFPFFPSGRVLMTSEGLFVIDPAL